MRGNGHAFITLLAGVVVALAIGTGTGRATATLPGSFTGSAFATYANVTAGPIGVLLGRTAALSCPCQGTNGKLLSNTVDTVSVGPGGSILTAAATLSTVFTDKTATTAAVQDTARVSGISLLGGLITADAIKAVASVNATSTTVTPSPAGSTFVNLKIAGSPINATVAPNSVVDIPGLGQVTLNKTHTSGDSQTNETLLVQMLVITVQTTNTFGLPVGATIVVAQAEAGFNRAQPAAVLSGLAYATYGNAAVGNTLSNTLGHTAGVSIGCVISGSHTNTNTIADVKATGILTTGAGNTSAFGQATANTALVKTTATITNVQLLGTLVTADAITAVAQDSLSGGVFTPSTAGSQFAGLKVAGVSIPINVPLNTTLPLLGIGYVVINEQIVSADQRQLQANGAHLVVTTANLLGLPVGAEIILAHAQAALAAF